jgi:hypothetical protein
MTDTKLYQLSKVNKRTGERTVIYGCVTANVVVEFWSAHTDTETNVEIAELDNSIPDWEMELYNNG